jgi:broad specificity phosphatase PhoE
MPFELQFMRHAESTSNVAQRAGTLRGYLELLRAVDPPLSQAGIQHCMRLRGYLSQPDYVFASPLRRAIQTAQIIWPRAHVIIVPFLMELGGGMQNRPGGKKMSTKGNLVQFVHWLRSWLKQVRPKRFRVVAVTHSLLLMRDLHLSSKPKNNETFRFVVRD